MFAPKNEEKVNSRAIFVIVVVERWASLYRINDRQGVLAWEISWKRPIWSGIPMIERSINRFERESMNFDQFHRPFSQHERIYLRSKPFWKYFYLDFYCWNCKPLLKLWIQKGWRTNRQKPHLNWSFRSWEIWIYSCVFSVLFFQPNRCGPLEPIPVRVTASGSSHC